MQKTPLIIGSNGYVSAIDTTNGQEFWRTKLREGFFTGSRGSDVSVIIDEDKVYAGCGGELYALRLSTGEILWSNVLKGLGYNEVALAIPGTNTQFITRKVHSSSSSKDS